MSEKDVENIRIEHYYKDLLQYLKENLKIKITDPEPYDYDKDWYRVNLFLGDELITYDDFAHWRITPSE